MIRNLFYIAVFALGTLAGSMFPSFSAQYQHALQARYEQVSVDLGPFREIADRYHGGSLTALIDYHLASTDPTFHDEGVAIDGMVRNQARLAEASESFEASLYRQALHLYVDGDRELASSTWDSFTPGVVTTGAALTFALSIGVILSLICFVSVKSVGMFVRKNG